jgi:hypothetical protein
MPYNSQLQRIWALGLMERWFCIWDDFKQIRKQ